MECDELCLSDLTLQAYHTDILRLETKKTIICNCISLISTNSSLANVQEDVIHPNCLVIISSGIMINNSQGTASDLIQADREKLLFHLSIASLISMAHVRVGGCGLDEGATAGCG